MQGAQVDVAGGLGPFCHVLLWDVEIHVSYLAI